ncbi:MAG: hypothetical protein HOH20_03800 [Rhodospirillaceae bacterium]|nr:hypothetical protein [Rhodospirillaceae bacterium]MBT5242170.1 hypothetical protein [Rhodospirillaceae bacterium]MBT6088682.1 hypothetical protein [Rhodospirillaceae bacterium]
MNRKRVILWMTVAVLVVLMAMTTVLLRAIPPWPVWLFFGISHGFFCAVVWRTQPYPGPHKEPMAEPTVGTHE